MDLIITLETDINGPRINLPDPRFLTYLKEDGVRKLLSDFYDLLVKSDIRDMFPQDPVELEAAKIRASDFIIQICGGHNYYHQNRGKPMLRKRHLPFTINSKARIIWLQCYREVLMKLTIPEHLIVSFWNYLDQFSFQMINQ